MHVVDLGFCIGAQVCEIGEKHYKISVSTHDSPGLT